MLPELNAFSEYLLYSPCMKYTGEMCAMVPSPERGSKPDPHQTMRLCITGLKHVLQAPHKWKPSFHSADGKDSSKAFFSLNSLEAFSDSEKGQIRRAKKSGVSVKEAGLEQGLGMV